MKTHLLPPFQTCYWICQTMGSFLHVLPIPIPHEYLRRDYMKFDSSMKQIISTPLNIPIVHLKFGSNYCGYRCINIYVFTLPAISTMISFQNSPWNTEERFSNFMKRYNLFFKKNHSTVSICKRKAELHWLQWGLVGLTLPQLLLLFLAFAAAPEAVPWRDRSAPSSLLLGNLYVLAF